MIMGRAAEWLPSPFGKGMSACPRPSIPLNLSQVGRSIGWKRKNGVPTEGTPLFVVEWYKAYFTILWQEGACSLWQPFVNGSERSLLKFCC